MIGLTLIKVLYYFGVPCAIGWFARMGWERVRHRAHLTALTAQRQHLLQSASAEELLNALAERSKEIAP